MADIIYDVSIIGAGSAGMTAAIYLGRAGKSVALIDKNGFGGNITNSPLVENIPGFKTISGADFACNMFEQVSALTTIKHIVEEAIFINYNHGLFLVSLSDRSVICSKSIIFATGSDHKTLNLDTSDIYYCATCDGPMFKNKNVIVVGSGNTGATYALELASYCKSVYLCDMTAKMSCEQVLQERISNADNIYWLPNNTIKAVKNDKNGKLNSITMLNNDTIKCSAIFAAIGLIPNTGIVRGFATLDQKGFIESVDTTVKIPGFFVAGDCRNGAVKQVVTATADGAVAALNAIKFLSSIK